MSGDYDNTTEDEMTDSPPEVHVEVEHDEAAWQALPDNDTCQPPSPDERVAAAVLEDAPRRATPHQRPARTADERDLRQLRRSLGLARARQQAAEQTLRATEARMQAILDSAPDCIISIDASGVIREFNHAAERTFGFARDEAVGQPVADLIIPPDLRERHYQGLARYLKTGRAEVLGERVELRGMRKDGSQMPIELTITRIPIDGPPFFTAHLRDITERVRADEERARLYEAEHAARVAAERAQHRFEFLARADALLVSSLDHEQSLNQLAWMIVGELADACYVDIREEDGAINRVALAHRDPRMLDLLRSIRARRPLETAPAHPIMRVLETGEPFLAPAIPFDLFAEASGEDAETLDDLRAIGFRSCVCAPLRARGWVVGALTLLASDSGRVYGPDDLALMEDLGLRAGQVVDNARLLKQTQRALVQVGEIADQLLMQATQLDAIIQAIPGVVFVCDARGHIIRVNPSGAAMLGQEQGERSWPDNSADGRSSVFSPDGAPLPPAQYPLKRALRGETSADFRCMMRRFDTGEEVQLLVSFAPIRDGTGAIAGAVAVGNDVTGMFRLDQQKDDFLSIASHELKTPLTSLKILAQLTRRRLARGGAKEAEQLAGMERSIERMERLVNDLLDVSRIQEGKLALRLTPCDLTSIAREAAEEQMAASERVVALELPEEPVVAMADAERIGQVLTNLLSNALKYSPPGCPVALSLEVIEGNSAHIVVRDEGAGIPLEDQEHLFERFYRVPGVQVQSGSGVGLGLGLYISREIVERHRGRMWVVSDVDLGAAFHFTLPLGALPADARSTP